jgi:transcriptional regulator with XRE-family HTH domain
LFETGVILDAVNCSSVHQTSAMAWPADLMAVALRYESARSAMRSYSADVDTVASLLASIVGVRPLRQVAARSGVRGGLLERYLNGVSLPASVLQLEAIGNACGADEWRLDRLVKAWVRQVNPPAEIHHDGFTFRTDQDALPDSSLDDLYHRVLDAVWRRTRWLVAVPGQSADRALCRLQLDELEADRKLRTSIRRDLVPGLHDRDYRAALPPSPDELGFGSSNAARTTGMSWRNLTCEVPSRTVE